MCSNATLACSRFPEATWPAQVMITLSRDIPLSSDLGSSSHDGYGDPIPGDCGNVGKKASGDEVADDDPSSLIIFFFFLTELGDSNKGCLRKAQ